MLLAHRLLAPRVKARGLKAPGQRVAPAPGAVSAQRPGRSLGEDAGLAEIHKLYRCHDRLLTHKQAVFDHLVGRWRDLFDISYDVLLSDLTKLRWTPFVRQPEPVLKV